MASLLTGDSAGRHSRYPLPGMPDWALAAKTARQDGPTLICTKGNGASRK